MANGWVSLLWFVAIVAAIPLVLWLLRRTPMLAGTGAPGAPRPVATLPVAPGQRLLTVEVGQGDDRLWLVLGVSAQGIRTLHTMVPQGETPTQPLPSTSATFAQLLGRLRQGGARRDGA